MLTKTESPFISQFFFPSYAVVGSFWENFLPYFKNALTGLYFTVHPNANPEMYYVPWVVSENPVDGMGDMSHVTIKTQVMPVTSDDDLLLVMTAVTCVQDREGIICPWDSHGALTWEYRTRDGGWAVDNTIQVQCLM